MQKIENYTFWHGWYDPRFGKENADLLPDPYTSTKPTDNHIEKYWQRKVLPIITNLLASGRLKEEYIIKLLLNPEVIQEYKKVFINSIYAKEFLNHQQFNYEFYEYIGDGIVNTSVISYIAERFPEYQKYSTKPQEVYTRLKITLVSTKPLQELLKHIDPNFWDLICCDNTKTTHDMAKGVTKNENGNRQTNRNKIMEDVFEALIGVTYTVINKYLGKNNSPTNGGPGYPICYNIITNLLEKDDLIQLCIKNQKKFQALDEYGQIKYPHFDEIIPYERVNDPITRLKQMMESKDNTVKGIGILRKEGVNTCQDKKILRILQQAYYNRKDLNVVNEQGHNCVYAQIWHIPGYIVRDQSGNEQFNKTGNSKLIGSGDGPNQSVAYAKACKNAINYLSSPEGGNFTTPKQESYKLKRNLKFNFNDPPPSPPGSPPSSD